MLVADAYSVVLTVVTGNPALLENSKGNRGLESLTLYGKSTQESTTGAQLFPPQSPGSIKKNGITIDCMEDGKIHIRGTAEITTDFYVSRVHLPTGTYTFSVGVTIDSSTIRYALVSDIGIPYFDVVNNDYATETIKETIELSLLLRVYDGKTINLTVQPMLNAGDTMLQWEPYTGGKPSPSPEYPQEIKSVGQDGEISVEVLGKNLIPFPYPELGGAGTQTEKEGVKYTVQGDGGIRCTGTPSSQFGVTITRIAYSATALSSSNPSNGKIILSGGELYFDPKNNALFIYYSPSQVGKPLDTVFYPQIELGTVATSYEKYKPAQTLIIPTPNGLPGVSVRYGGNYTDADGQQWVSNTIEFRNGLAEIVQRISKTIVDGNKVKFKLSSDRIYVNLPLFSSPGITEIYRSNMSQYFPAEFFRGNTDKDFIWCLYEQAKKYFETVDELNAFCVEKYEEGDPLTIFYFLRSPTRTPLTAEELAAYKTLRTYSPTTTVINDAGAGMSVGYAKMK